LPASFQHSQSSFALGGVTSNSSTSCTASHFVHPLFQNWLLSLKFCLKRWVCVEGREELSSARVEDNGEGKPPSWCVVVVEGGMVVMGLLRVSSNRSWPWTTDFDHFFQKYRSLVMKGYGGGEAP
jgi:hypothetical protein